MIWKDSFSLRAPPSLCSLFHAFPPFDPIPHLHLLLASLCWPLHPDLHMTSSLSSMTVVFLHFVFSSLSFKTKINCLKKFQQQNIFVRAVHEASPTKENKNGAPIYQRHHSRWADETKQNMYLLVLPFRLT